MTDPRDHEWQDPELSAWYQAMPKVEPPSALDERIVTAARAAVAPRPAPAIPRFRSFRFWATPVALAATLIMAVGLVQLTREAGERKPSMDMKVQSSAKPAAEADATSVGRLESKAADRALPAAPPASPTPESSSLSLPMERRKTDLLQEAPAAVEKETTVRQLKTERSPKAWLADIAELRRQGRTAEAEASLAEFRRRYPDYHQP